MKGYSEMSQWIPPVQLMYANKNEKNKTLFIFKETIKYNVHAIEIIS
jgi:hypothetical protein